MILDWQHDRPILPSAMVVVYRAKAGPTVVIELPGRLYLWVKRRVYPKGTGKAHD